MEIVSLSITLLMGVFILIGTFIAFYATNLKNNDKFIHFSLGLAFGVMIMISIFDIAPEVYESLSTRFAGPFLYVIMVVTVLLGVGVLKLLDMFIPDHHDKDEKDNLHHIGLISSVALVIHNLIEGMALYNIFLSSFKSGLLLCIGIGLHNIPLGMVIATTLLKNNKSRKKTILISILLSLSTFLGGAVMFILNGYINELILTIVLALTLGMIIYLCLFEILSHLLEKEHKKESFLGVLIGILIIVVTLLI